MTKESDLHNEITVEFVQKTLRKIIRSGASLEDLLVIYESLSLSVLMTLTNHYKVQPQHAATYIEEVLHNTLERFTEIQSKGGT